MNQLDLAWLGGFWDGEGTITMFSHREKNGSLKIKPIIAVVNTDLCLINKTRKILEDIECNFVLTEYKSKNRRHKDRWTLSSGNQKTIIKFLDAILPFVNSYKKQSGEIIRDYCKRRQDKMQRLPSKGSTPYDEQDWKDFKSVRSSQTTREGTKVQDIVETLV